MGSSYKLAVINIMRKIGLLTELYNTFLLLYVLLQNMMKIVFNNISRLCIDEILSIKLSIGLMKSNNATGYLILY